ncbi:MAG TPA: hypothetical protein VLC08_00480 [Chitinolyticbacter sp.]|nr:hypothetical protein [Chitinolyticbacter sp.]
MKRITLAGVLLACTAGACASESLVESAIAKRNYELAFATAKADVADDSASDYTRMVLAQLYLQGLGVERNPKAAELVLRPLAERGVVEAQFLLAGSLMGQSAEQLKDADNQLDRARLAAQAAKPAKERPLEREAAEWNYKAAQQGLDRAVHIVATELGNLVSGVPSAERATWFEQAGKPEWAAAVRLGESIASLRQRREALQNADIEAAIQRQQTAADCEDENARISATRLDGAVEGADYLVLQVGKPLNYTLLAGRWREVWTFSACGKSFPLTIAFQADGLGGAKASLAQPAAK